MSLRSRQHEWIVAPYRDDRASVRRRGGARHVVDAHRNHCGPYTAPGEIVRRVIDQAYGLAPDLVFANQLTLLSVAPDIRQRIRVSDEVERSFAFSREGNPRSWTNRLAHGLADFLLGCQERVWRRQSCITFENVDFADPVDHEFIAILLRRADPQNLLVRVCSTSNRLDAPPLSALQTETRVLHPEPAPIAVSGVPERWRTWLLERTSGWRAEWRMLGQLAAYLPFATRQPPAGSLGEFLDASVASLPLAVRRRLASEHVKSNNTSDRLLQKLAYQRLPTAERRELHRRRAAALAVSDQRSAALGAIPLHCEGAGEDAAPLLSASKYCMHMAYYDAALDWARRGREMLDLDDRGPLYGEFTRNILFSQLLLGRYGEVEAICADAWRTGADPTLLAQAAYAMAIINARMYDPSRRDYDAARQWVEKALACAERLPLSEDRAVNLAFLRNTSALVQMRKGDHAGAERLMLAAVDYMAAEAPSRFSLECPILLHNLARLHTAMRQSDKAIDDLTKLLQHEPSNCDAYLDRGVLFHRLGDYEAALRDYDAAINWSPPYAKPYFNRALTLVALGRTDEAYGDYDRVLTLEPDHIEARSRGPGSARLLFLRGLLELQRNEPDAALRSFTAAIEADPGLADAWANRATIFFQRRDLDAALRDLTRALGLRNDANLRYNRGRVFEAQQMWDDAAKDYELALTMVRGDSRHIIRHLRTCRRAMLASRATTEPLVKLEKSTPRAW